MARKTDVTDVQALPEVKTNELSPFVEPLTSERNKVEIVSQFTPFLEEVLACERGYEITVSREEDIKEMQEAREIRLALVKNRTATNKLRQAMKADALQYGRVLDGIFNFIKEKSEALERYLEAQEKFVEIKEAKEKEERAKKRLALLEAVDRIWEVVPINQDFGAMDEATFNLMLDGALKQIVEIKAKEAKEAKEKEAKEIALELENKKLKEREALQKARFKEVAEVWGYGTQYEITDLADFSQEDFESVKSEKTIAKQVAMKKAQEEEKAKREQEEKARKENEAIAIRKAEDRARIEQQEKARLAKEAEEKAKEQEAKRLASAPDREKFTLFISEIVKLKNHVPHGCKSQNGRVLAQRCVEMLDKMEEYLKNNIEKV